MQRKYNSKPLIIMLKKTSIIFGLFLLGSVSGSAQEWAEQAKNELCSCGQLVQGNNIMSANYVSSFSELEDIDLNVAIINPTTASSPIKRSPVHAPSLSIIFHTLYFNTSCDGCRLRLINEDGIVEMDTIIPQNTSTITLPYYLVGEYELQIIRGNYCFFGYIDL